MFDVKFSGFVLAGGKSSRMKTDKALLHYAGESFLELAFHKLELVCDDVKIVVNDNQIEEFARKFPTYKFITDVFKERGALGGIHAALKNTDADWAFILACDLPFVSKKTIKNLLEIAADSSNEGVQAVVPIQFDGRFQPLCAAYRVRECLPALEKHLSENFSNRVSDFLETIKVKSIEIAQTDDENVFFNVNRPSDFLQITNK
jgi:molybdopterin-guanine dinucleotide biosynthesis protein A